MGASKSNLFYSINESKTEGMWVEKGDNRRGSGGGGGGLGGQTWKASCGFGRGNIVVVFYGIPCIEFCPALDV